MNWLKLDLRGQTNDARNNKEFFATMPPLKFGILQMVNTYLFSHTSSNFDHFRNKCEILFVTYGFIFAKGKQILEHVVFVCTILQITNSSDGFTNFL